ncbi:hypothetical protein ACLB2K_045459 [Fragaria x ananassa]
MESSLIFFWVETGEEKSGFSNRFCQLSNFLQVLFSSKVTVQSCNRISQEPRKWIVEFDLLIVLEYLIRSEKVDLTQHMQLLGEAAIKFRGVEADINDDIEDYEDDLKQIDYILL